MTPPPPLTIRRVSKHYGGVEALRDVSFALDLGGIVGLIGANGAGKSTLLDIIGGEQPQDSGEVLLDGVPLIGSPHERARRGLARTFQHPKVSLDMTVFENVAVGLAVREMSTKWQAMTLPLKAIVTGRTPSRAEVEEACREVGLTDLDRPARLLSFGELRLLEVARAVIQRPRFILLDEPFPGVEEGGVALLIRTLRRLATAGRTVLVVDHNVLIIEALVQSVILMARGAVVFSGSIQECVRSREFQQEYVGSAR